MDFQGYLRPNGQVGVRNYIAVIPSVFCANTVARNIASQVKSAIAFCHPLGCSQVGADLELTARTLISIGRNPNFGAVLVVGLGCERFTAQELYDGIVDTGKPIKKIVIQEEGDTLKAIAKGVLYASRMSIKLSTQERCASDISKLVVGVKCGGTDATSGIAANPVIGYAVDQLVKAGGTAIFSEVTELLGAEDSLAARAVNSCVARDIIDTIGRMEEKLRRTANNPDLPNRSALISTGNYEGGVSTVVEKALGNIYKSGTQPISGVISYAQPASEPGLYLMDSPGHDGEVVTGLVGGGAQIVVFSTGRGTPSGFPGVPVIKTTGNNQTYQRMEANIDVNSGTVISGEETLTAAGERLWDLVLRTADGSTTKAEALGQDELFCISRL